MERRQRRRSIDDNMMRPSVFVNAKSCPLLQTPAARGARCEATVGGIFHEKHNFCVTEADVAL
jgi:hypothetical protein